MNQLIEIMFSNNNEEKINPNEIFPPFIQEFNKEALNQDQCQKSFNQTNNDNEIKKEDEKNINPTVEEMVKEENINNEIPKSEIETIQNIPTQIQIQTETEKQNENENQNENISSNPIQNIQNEQSDKNKEPLITLTEKINPEKETETEAEKEKEKEKEAEKEKEYYEDGKLRFEGEYLYNIRWRGNIYDKSGNIIYQSHYILFLFHFLIHLNIHLHIVIYQNNHILFLFHFFLHLNIHLRSLFYLLYHN